MIKIENEKLKINDATPKALLKFKRRKISK